MQVQTEGKGPCTYVLRYKMVKLNGAWKIISLQREAGRGERETDLLLYPLFPAQCLDWMVLLTAVTLRLCSRWARCRHQTSATCTVHIEQWSSSPPVGSYDQCSLRRAGKEEISPFFMWRHWPEISQNLIVTLRQMGGLNCQLALVAFLMLVYLNVFILFTVNTWNDKDTCKWHKT